MAFGKTLFSGSRFIFWTLTPILFLVLVWMPFSIEKWDATRVAVVVAIDSVSLLLILALYDPKCFYWAARGVTALVFLAYVAYVIDELFVSGKALFQSLCGLVIIGLPALWYTLWGRFSLFEKTVTAIDPNDPLWLESIRRTQEALPELQKLFGEERREAIVKFSFTTDSGDCEHVWGELSEIDGNSMQVKIITPPVAQKSQIPDVVTVPLSSIEDWHVNMPDGSIRGSFSTLAQIKICERDGLEVPHHIREIERRLNAQ